MWPFKRKPESPQERAAEERLDEASREVAAEELDKEAGREQQGFLGPFTPALRREKRVPLRRVAGDPVPEPVDDPDPVGPGGLRDALREEPPAP